MDDTTRDDSHDQTLSDLRGALRAADPVPANVVAAAKEAYTWRTIDEELAALVADSDTDDPSLVGVRSTGSAARLLSFEYANGAVEVEISILDERIPTGQEQRSRIVGQVAPAGPATVTFEMPTGEGIVVEADALGRFALDLAVTGAVRVRVESTHLERPVVTSWIQL